MTSKQRQPVVLRIDSEVARAVRGFLFRGEHGYSGIDDFVEAALANQLSAEGAAVVPMPDTPREIVEPTSRRRILELGQGHSESLKERIDVREESLSVVGYHTDSPPPSPLVGPAQIDDESLFVLTNRISPIKVAVRSLAESAIGDGDWPTVAEFLRRAGNLARQIGTQLRNEGSRRWVGYPIGADSGKAKERFVSSFAMSAPGGRARGPMVLLGLANVIAPSLENTHSVRARRRQVLSRSRNAVKVALTSEGWRLALLPSPILDGGTEGTLFDEEAALLTRAVLSAPKEREVIRTFLGMVRRSAGSQARLDELMAARNSGKSAGLVVAERAAIIGRLSELRLVQHHGRGAKARVMLTDKGIDLLAQLRTEDTNEHSNG